MEQRVKQQLGEMMFMLLAYQEQLEQAKTKIAELEKVKNAKG